MFCTNCGKELPDGAVFCNICGQRLKTPAAPIPAAEPEPAPEAAFEPEPIFEPEPVPEAAFEPEPEPVFEPEPEPVFVPEPEPEPVSGPRRVRETPVSDEPAFAPEPEPELPAENRPLSPWAYFGYTLLFLIPVIGWALLIVLSFSRRNINLRNFARSFWCGAILILAIVLIALVLILTNVLKGPMQQGLNWLRDVGLPWLSRSIAQ